MHFLLSSRVTVPWGHFCKWGQLGPPCLRGASRHYWLMHSDLLMPRSCQSSSARPLRAQDTGKQEWEVWPRGTQSLLLTPGPMCSQMFNTSSGCPSKEILLEKQSHDLAAAGNQKESCQPRYQCLISTSVSHDTRTWMDSFIYSFIRLLEHSLTIYWGKCARWKGIKGDKDQKVPTLKEIKNFIMRQINSHHTLLFQVCSQRQRHCESC